jgi:NAD(P)H dehydrogenase (quinone)
MARKIAEVIKGEKLEVDVKKIEDTHVDSLLDYDCILIGSPTYYGSMAWPVKKLLDESIKFHGKLRGKVGGAFSSSANIGGGNETTILNILNAMLIHGMVIRGESSGDHYGPVSIGEPDKRALKCCERYALNISSLVRKLF